MNVIVTLLAVVVSITVQSAWSMEIPALYVGPRSIGWYSKYGNQQRFLMPRNPWTTINRRYRPSLRIPQYLYRKYKHPRQRYPVQAPRSRFATYTNLYETPAIRLPFKRRRQELRQRRYRQPQGIISLERNWSSRRRRMPTFMRTIMCPWKKIATPEQITFFENVLEEYDVTSKTKHTIKGIATKSILYCKRCGPRGCSPDRHEIKTTFTLAPTNGCDWKKKCRCTARQNSDEVECKASGIIPYGTKKVNNLVLVCDGVSIVNENVTEVVMNENNKEIITPKTDAETTGETISGYDGFDIGSGDVEIVTIPTQPTPQEEIFKGKPDKNSDAVAAPLLQIELEQEELLKY